MASNGFLNSAVFGNKGYDEKGNRGDDFFIISKLRDILKYEAACCHSSQVGFWQPPDFKLGSFSMRQSQTMCKPPM